MRLSARRSEPRTISSLLTSQRLRTALRGKLMENITLKISPSEQPQKLTPMQALYDLMIRHGYVRTKADFASALRINGGNIYAYLGNPEPREGKPEDLAMGRNTTRISASPEILHGWCWAITNTTEMTVAIGLGSDGNILIEASGKDAQGRKIPRVTYVTTYGEFDFRPPSHWGDEWEAQSNP